jgi:hypothetical protein
VCFRLLCWQAGPTLPPHRLPTPLHVTLNHLNCTTISENLMVQSVTQRYAVWACAAVCVGVFVGRWDFGRSSGSVCIMQRGFT